MKKVMAFGTFDIFHPGHKSFLIQARALGDFLVVVVARDSNVLKIKNQASMNDEQERLRILRESNLADEVILGDLYDRYFVIGKYSPDIITLGYDQKVDEIELKNKLCEFGLETGIIRLKAFQPEKFKSSKLKKILKKS